MELTIPATERAAFLRYAGLDVSRREAIVGELSTMAPFLDRRDTADWLSEKTGVSAEILQDFLRFLGALYYLSADLLVGAEALAEAVCSVAERDPLAKRIAPEANWSTVRKEIAGILSVEGNLELSFKANHLLSGHEHVFRDAEVISDVRPIFGKDAAQGAKAALVVHSLRLRFHSHGSGAGDQEIFVALQDEQIDYLLSLLQRAKIKDEQLRKLVIEANLKTIGPTPK